MSKFLFLKLSDHIRRDRVGKAHMVMMGHRQNVSSLSLSCQHNSPLGHPWIFAFSWWHEFFRYNLVFMFLYNQRRGLIFITDQKISVFLEKERNSLVSINVVYTINFFFFLCSTNERPQNLTSEKKLLLWLIVLWVGRAQLGGSPLGPPM